MAPERVCEILGEDACAAQLSLRWDEAMRARPADQLPFLDPAGISAAHRACGLDETALAALQAVAAEVSGDPVLQALAWYLHWRLWHDPTRGNMPAPPSLERRLGDLAGAFHLLLAIGFPAALKAVHVRRGYPEDVTAETVQQVRCFYGNHLRGRRLPGVYARQLTWLRTYVDDPYVRLGRFEFQLTTLAAPVIAWRHRDGAITAFAEHGLGLDAEGLCPPGGASGAGGWTAQFTEEPAFVQGHRITVDGRAERTATRLERGAWQPFLRRGDTILSLHIPAGGGMDLTACADSFRRAAAFFPRHHPESPPSAIWCSTWFLDPQLRRLLPADANPLRLQRCLQLHPVPPWGDGGLWFVFLMDTADPERLPRDTSLQRALAGFLAAGGRWRGGAGFLPFDQAADLRER